MYDAVRRCERTPFREDVWRELSAGFRFVQGTFGDDDAFARLASTLTALDEVRGTDGNHAFYLSIPPAAFPVVCDQPKRSGVGPTARWAVAPRRHREAVRARPGERAQTQRRREQRLPEHSVFRIDHYLGKETVQNILALRFANQLFRPGVGAHYIDHVQITMAGTSAWAGARRLLRRDRGGSRRHSEPPAAVVGTGGDGGARVLRTRGLQAEKIKVLSATRNIAPLDENSARGRYGPGWQGNEGVRPAGGEGFAKDSTTETYAAIALEVDTRRWAGVPFYLRTGKRLGRRVTEIAVVFKRAPHLPFDSTMTAELGQNALVIRVQPDEGVTLRFGSKVPGSSMEVRDVNMDFSYGEAFTESSPRPMSASSSTSCSVSRHCSR